MGSVEGRPKRTGEREGQRGEGERGRMWEVDRQEESETKKKGREGDGEGEEKRRGRHREG